MNERLSNGPWLTATFFENQRKVTPEMLIPYMGKHIAWNWDGDQIVGAAETRDELWDTLERAGIDTQRVVFGYIPNGDSFIPTLE